MILRTLFNGTVFKMDYFMILGYCFNVSSNLEQTAITDLSQRLIIYHKKTKIKPYKNIQFITCIESRYNFDYKDLMIVK